MDGTPGFDAVILGAGFAGRLAALTLRQAGARVALVGMSDRPVRQAVHVHQLSPKAWDELSVLVPDLMDRLGVSGCTGPAQLSRATLDRLMQTCVEQASDIVRVPRVSEADRSGGQWLLRIQGEERLRADWLIDASGSARAGCKFLSSLSGQAVSLEDVEADFACKSWRVKGVAPSSGDKLVRATVMDGQCGILCQFLGNGRATLTLHGLPEALHAIEDPLTLAQSSDNDGLQNSFREAYLASGPYRWRGQWANRILLEESEAARFNWFALGDSLLTTPPILGWGLAQAIEQTALLARTGLAADIVPALDALAEPRMRQATVASFLRTSSLSRNAATHADTPSASMVGERAPAIQTCRS
ncbi:NAD(P)/FAD-dependent oxidoreductase [Henriciella aquimarina]|uniref:NAD(P)/FAD-dependent oxidoreductase n=1 Tax=Henriciella aquimarina TaxID=545261 RepID=UPI001301B672|nr:FAD-dependent oxidoreductase [Henriciella aquimarina]